MRGCGMEDCMYFFSASILTFSGNLPIFEISSIAASSVRPRNLKITFFGEQTGSWILEQKKKVGNYLVTINKTKCYLQQCVHEFFDIVCFTEVAKIIFNGRRVFKQNFFKYLHRKGPFQKKYDLETKFYTLCG